MNAGRGNNVGIVEFLLESDCYKTLPQIGIVKFLCARSASIALSRIYRDSKKDFIPRSTALRGKCLSKRLESNIFTVYTDAAEPRVTSQNRFRVADCSEVVEQPEL